MVSNLPTAGAACEMARARVRAKVRVRASARPAVNGVKDSMRK